MGKQYLNWFFIALSIDYRKPTGKMSQRMKLGSSLNVVLMWFYSGVVSYVLSILKPKHKSRLYRSNSGIYSTDTELESFSFLTHKQQTMK